MDLAREVKETCSVHDSFEEKFHFAGPDPFLVEIDAELLQLALANVVRNAVEAISALPEDTECVITINWGRAGHEIWISVLDSGLGFDGDPNSMVEFGKSTKDGHIGFGLATAKQAMQSLDGDIFPDNASSGGARVELRWLEGDANTTS